MTIPFYGETIKFKSYGTIKIGYRIGDHLAVAYASDIVRKFRIFNVYSGKPITQLFPDGEGFLSLDKAHPALLVAQCINTLYGRFLWLWKDEPELDVIGIFRYVIPSGHEFYKCFLTDKQEFDWILIKPILDITEKFDADYTFDIDSKYYINHTEKLISGNYYWFRKTEWNNWRIGFLLDNKEYGQYLQLVGSNDPDLLVVLDNIFRHQYDFVRVELPAQSKKYTPYVYS